MAQNDISSRLEGIDLARFISLLGMILINFSIFAGVSETKPGFIASIINAFEGKAAATFVTLAAIGLSLLVRGLAQAEATSVLLKRVLFLLVVGHLHLMIFDADIIHYYAFYFLFGFFFLRAQTSLLIAVIINLLLLFIVLAVFFDYDWGWDWENLTYGELWTGWGFISHLFFNGWHPVIPWFSFFLFGLILGRMPLQNRKIQLLLATIGFVMLIIIKVLSLFVVNLTAAVLEQGEIAILLSTSPIPPSPFFILMGISAASLIRGLSLIVAETMMKWGWGRFLLFLTRPGRQTLTIYLAHAIIGIPLIEILSTTNLEPITVAVIAAVIYAGVAVILANLWSLYFQQGPVEMVMRYLTGPHRAKSKRKSL